MALCKGQNGPYNYFAIHRILVWFLHCSVRWKARIFGADFALCSTRDTVYPRWLTQELQKISAILLP